MNNLSTLETMITRDSAARRFVEQLDKNELSSLSGEIFAKFYWYKRNPQWFKKIPIDNSLGFVGSGASSRNA